MLNAVIDISHHQSYVNFDKLAAAGIVGVFHKATQGVAPTPAQPDPLNPDPDYARRRGLAHEAGLLWGAYHFGSSDGSGQEQAEFFLQTAAPAPTDLLMLDFELYSVQGQNYSMSTQQAQDFVTYVFEQTGRYPGLYSSVEYLLQMGAATNPVLANCWLWVSRYNAQLNDPDIHGWGQPVAWNVWTMWQYTDGIHGGTLDGQPLTVSGIGPDPAPGPCDRDIFNGSLADLYRLWNCPLPAAATPGTPPA